MKSDTSLTRQRRASRVLRWRVRLVSSAKVHTKRHINRVVLARSSFKKYVHNREHQVDSIYDLGEVVHYSSIIDAEFFPRAVRAAPGDEPDLGTSSANGPAD